MKLLNLFAALGLLCTGASQAATIDVGAGLPATQGFTPTTIVGGVAQPLASFSWAVGTWDAATQVFSTFGSSVLDTGEVNGSVTATGPATFNGQVIALFIGTGSSIAESGQNWVVLASTNASTLFPADVSQATAVGFNATTPGSVTFLAKGNEAHNFGPLVQGQGYNLNFVPEPSTALLGALGMVGFLRRRRR
ncbi:PEP-CTERM sorting domain-containing protein [Luteolibacter luteus]|uniref:PEP-CTERM sorting domain-containing protein n=1 Tax=Luteolibacter luteus TaxID=2728835 RepID=A0A858RJW6_9BACT|nr:PEP-CTERM sorting domain-containing protein [Luteolibacter luteus]QJE96500.1 PEP-CTERM sorting domain-containing protein [Luteolibacter luteus]